MCFCIFVYVIPSHLFDQSWGARLAQACLASLNKNCSGNFKHIGKLILHKKPKLWAGGLDKSYLGFSKFVILQVVNLLCSNMFDPEYNNVRRGPRTVQIDRSRQGSIDKQQIRPNGPLVESLLVGSMSCSWLNVLKLAESLVVG